MSDDLGKLVSKRVKFYEKLQSGQKQTFVKAQQKFYLHLKMTDPKQPRRLINLPAGIRVRLMANDASLANSGASAETDAQGKVCLAPDAITAKLKPDYHFRIDLDERTYIDVDTLKLAPSKKIKRFDQRKLFELPMVVDTATGGFHYDSNKVKLVDGKFKNYDSKKKGEGTAGDPLVLELRFYWYFMKFTYFDRIKNEWRDVPAEMPVVPRLDENDDYLNKYILKDFLELGYVLDSEPKKIQHYLNLLGFQCGAVDGIIGPKTRAGIKAFQKQYELKIDGIAGPITQRTLEQIFYRRNIGVYESGRYAVPVWKKGLALPKPYFEMAQPAQICAPALQLVSSREAARFDLFLYTKDKSANPIVVPREQIAEDNKNVAYDKLDHTKARLYYDLPVEWSSRNYWTRYDNSMDKGERYQKVMTEKVNLYPFVASEANRAKPVVPLIFSLDDIVLAKTDRDQTITDQATDGTSKALDDKSRFALFYVDHDTKETVEGKQKNMRRMKIHKPETAQPVFTDFAFKSNLITDVAGHSRVVAFCSGFHDVTNKRSSRSDQGFSWAKQHVAGARLAVLNDPDVHVRKTVNAGTADDINKAFALNNCGNYELHYLHNCAELDGKTLSYLFIYWSCRFESKNKDPWNRPVTPGGQAGIDNHRKEGMVNAMERLNKNYLIEKHSGDTDIYIRPFHYMEAKSDANGGRHKAMVNIVGNGGPNGGAWMTLNNAQLRLRDYKSDPHYFGNPDPGNNLQDADGKSYQVLTNHHEMGHATGNWDDYLYDCEDLGKSWSNLPKYSQTYTAEGGPYSEDKLSRMNNNRISRLRNFWKFVCWLNDEAKSGRSLHPLLKQTRFKITFHGTSHKHEFEIAETYRNVAKAAKTGYGKTIKAHAKADLLLYKLGDDEYSRLAVAGQVFNGILVVKTKIAINFVNSGPINWTVNNAVSWSQQLNNQIRNDLNNKFRISTAANNDFKNILLLFVPAYNMLKTAAPAGFHINCRVKSRTGRNPSPACQQHATDKNRLDLDRDATIRRAMRFCFGETTGTGALDKSQFSKIVDWVKTECSDNGFAIHDL